MLWHYCARGAIAGLVAIAVAGPAGAVVLIEDRFEREFDSEFDAPRPTAGDWVVTGASVSDRVTRLPDGGGLHLTATETSLRSRKRYRFVAGSQVTVAFVLPSPCPVGVAGTEDSVCTDTAAANTITARLGEIYDETFERAPAAPPLRVERRFRVRESTVASLEFEFDSTSTGVIVDDVILAMETPVPFRVDPAASGGAIAILAAAHVARRRWQHARREMEASAQ